jgi:hypothetical protein
LKFNFLSLLFLFNINYVSNVVHGECGEDYRDIWYVCQVINNRYKEWNYKDYYAVVTDENQFNGYKKIKEKKVRDSIECIIHRVYYNDIPDSLRIHKKVLFFYNPKISSKSGKRYFRNKRVYLKNKTKHGEHHYCF